MTPSPPAPLPPGVGRKPLVLPVSPLPLGEGPGVSATIENTVKFLLQYLQHHIHHSSPMYLPPFYLKLLGAALLIFAAKLWFIHHFGGPVPFWDEWTFARGVFLPWMNAHLTVSDLLAAHNEHRPVFTRLLNLGLFILNKQWDPFLGMIVNAALSTLTAIFLLVVTRNRLGKNVEDLLLFCVLLLWILPYGWENLVWSFQIGWYIMVLFSLLAAWGLLLHKHFTWPWWLGATCGFLAFFNIASGMAMLLVIIVVKLYLITIDAGQRLSHLPTLLISTGMVSLCSLFIAPTPPGGLEGNIGTFFFALGSNLAWPWVTHPLFSLLLYLPLFALGMKIIWLRRKPSSAELWILAVGGWVILQAVILAYARSTTMVYLQGAGPNSRYMDALALGLLMNLLAFHFIAQNWYGLPPVSKRHLNTYASLWGGIFISGLFYLMFTNPLGGLPAIQDQAWRRVDQLNYSREFLQTGDVNIFKDKLFKHVPFYFPEELASLLNETQVRSILPHSLAKPAILSEVNSPLPENPPFVRNGLEPTFEKYQNEEILGSYSKNGHGTVGRFLSTPIHLPQGFLEIPVSGYLGETGLSLFLVVSGTDKPIEIVPPVVPGKYWVSCYVPTPAQPFQLLAIDNRTDRWFAFAMPRGIGTLSYWTSVVFQHGQFLLFSGILLLWFIFVPNWFRKLTTEV